jgi:ribosomal protein S18 acetylase RimI-like enzyme
VPEIVRADASRIDELEPLWLALLEHHGSVTPDRGPTRPPAESWARRRVTYRDSLDQGGTLFLAVDDDGSLLGLAICEQEQGGGSPTWSWPPDILALVDLIVLPEARGRGLGRLLLRAVEDEAAARGVAAVEMNVAGPNDSARRFYEAHGYGLANVEYRKPLGDGPRGDLPNVSHPSGGF